MLQVVCNEGDESTWEKKKSKPGHEETSGAIENIRLDRSKLSDFVRRHQSIREKQLRLREGPRLRRGKERNRSPSKRKRSVQVCCYASSLRGALLRNVSRLASRQSRDGITYFCDFCSFSNRVKEKVLKHQESCSGEVLEPERVFPTPGTFLKFKNCERSAEQPFVIYADFESRLRPMFVKKGESTSQYQEHIPVGYAYYLVCRFDPSENIFRSYTARSNDEDIGLHFLKSLRDTVLDLWMKFKYSRAMSFTTKDRINFREAKECWICGKKFSFVDNLEEKIVRDHCHYTGKYRGAAHASCNLRLRQTKRIPVIFHNFTGYDNHLFVKSLGKIEGEISVIARNEEKHVSVTKDILVDSDQRWQLRFSDSSSFMCGSLDSHVSNLRSVGERRKGVFPYEWLTDVAHLNQTCLPKKDQFYSRPNSNGITDAEYAHAKDVWKTFEMKSMREYHDLYLKTDVLLLADVFENFLDMALEHFKVDPCHYVTAPAMFFDALLKMSDVELELISDPEMYDFVERAKRGGVSSIMKRYAEANNKHMGDRYDPSKPSSYIFYPDANSLYCWPMLQPLPVGGFRWLSAAELEKPLSEFPPCFVSVDLEYPEELHDKFKDYPPAPDQIKLGGVEKLAPNLLPKTEYVGHIRNIQKYEELGCRITKVHRELAFDENPWMKTYVERNIEQRKKARNSFEKDFWKLANNSVFGKTCENVMNRVDVRLVKERKKALKQILKPNYKQHTIYNVDLVGIQMGLNKVKLNKLSYVGVAILDLSKILMFDFYYNFVQPTWGDRAEVLFTDTDSLALQVHTEDLYKDIEPHVGKWFDTSKLKPGNLQGLPAGINSGIVGKFKDEEPNDLITEFVGIRAKNYAYTTLGGTEKKKDKGIKKAVIKIQITFDDFKDCVLNGVVKHVTQNTIRSRKHEVFTESLCKKALCPKDDKRVILEDGINTLPIGHVRVPPKDRTK